ncbi:ribosomal RNA-processing protein 8 [Neodiprion lecontei]|uniref:Ribosomal RNA-processing protein 8 n=1 Tax=Neodiprion lecontei TaxID=441921 RepID=A0ABM3GEZ0_NEOLC|nr:ribosomal RNA-processing protein 8 [Neodiprion lecontei]
MRIFKESAWEIDVTGDKLTNELFIGRKKKAKPTKISVNILQAEKKSILRKKPKSKVAKLARNAEIINLPAARNGVSSKKRKSSDSTINETSIKKWKSESHKNSDPRSSANANNSATELSLKKNKPNKVNKKKIPNNAHHRIRKQKLEPNGDLLAKRIQKQKLKRKKKKLKNLRNSSSTKEPSIANLTDGRDNSTTDVQAEMKDDKNLTNLKVSTKVIESRITIDRLQKLLAEKQQHDSIKIYKKSTEQKSLRDRMLARLKSSRFRYLNEQMYNSESWSSKKYFKEDPDAFLAYHEGYQLQVEQWPLNPLDTIIASIKKMPKDYIVADFGCGEARLAASVTQKVHSLDLVAINDKVTTCDMAHSSLLTGRIDVVVFCLSLMGTNLTDYLTEANRVLKKDGILKIAEVESRFNDVDEFIKTLGVYGFVNTWKDLSHNLFYFMDFKKDADVTKKRSKLPPLVLNPCLYKKR